MQKKILIFSTVVAVLGLTAFAFISPNNSEVEPLEIATNEPAFANDIDKPYYNFAFNVGNRFSTIKKEELNYITAFTNLIGEEHASRIASYKSLSIIVMKDEKQTNVRVDGTSGVFNEAQIAFLQSLPYSTNITIWADFLEKNPETGALEDAHWTPYFTVVPEKEVVYSDGDAALIKYLRENTKERTASVDTKKLRPGILHFTVTKTGTIKNVRLIGTSGYKEIDEDVIKLIKNIPGTWEPAENVKGEKVNQELTLMFGTAGC